MIGLRIVRGVTHHFVGRWSEWLLALTLFVLGLKLVGPDETFRSSASFNVLAGFAVENTWGVTMLVVGALRLVALTINGTFRGFARLSPLIRTVMSVMSGFVWFSLALGFYLANPDGLGYIVYAAMLLADCISAMLAAQDWGQTERKYRYGSATGGE